MVTYTCDEVEQQLRQLKEFSFRLGDSMEQTANDLRTQGTSPSAQLISDLQNYREVFSKMRSWLQSQSAPAAAGLDLSPATLTDLETGLTSQLARTRALEFIEQVRRLTHIEGDQHHVVAVIQQACEAAHETILGEGPTSDETIASLNEGRHSLAVLWTLVTRGDTLEDNEWTELLEQCTNQLGREVATTVARRRLIVRDTDV